MSYDSSPTAQQTCVLGESSHSDILHSRHQTDIDDMRLLNGHSSPDRLSPNLFLNLNFDSVNTSEFSHMSNSNNTPLNALTFEWSTSSQNSFLTTKSHNRLSSPPPSSIIINSGGDSPTPSYDSYIDQFNILNLDQSILTASGAIAINDVDKTGNHCLNLDNLQPFSLSEEEKGTELLDLEKPINLENYSDPKSFD